MSLRLVARRNLSEVFRSLNRPCSIHNQEYHRTTRGNDPYRQSSSILHANYEFIFRQPNTFMVSIRLELPF